MRSSIITGKKEKVMYTVTKFLVKRSSWQVDIGYIAAHGNLAPGKHEGKNIYIIYN
jgi:hypothetical protein